MNFKLQSAMEYLMTYGWAILIIAVVLGALYQLGVFGSGTGSVGPSCLADAGFLCQNPTLNTSGWLAIKFGQIGLSSITITSLGCTNNNTAPVSTTTVNIKLTSGSTAGLSFSCPLASNSIGAGFQGYLWLTYSTPTQPSIVDKVAVVSAKVSTTGNSLAVVGGGLTAGGYIAPVYDYCIGINGGKAIYSSVLTSNGVGQWTAQSNYPVAVFQTGCSASGGYLYCVGSGTSPYTQAYYASVSLATVGSWTATTSYPIALQQAGCSIYSGYIYCIGTIGVFPYTFTYSAPISSAGIGSWTSTRSYPVGMYSAGCSIDSGYIYCVGDAAQDQNVYYASVSGGVIGSWTATTSYPVGAGDAGCNIYGGYIYCVGTVAGTQNYAYYAPVSSSGIGVWSSTTTYPTALLQAGCTIYNGYIYCVGNNYGGSQQNVNYAQVGSTGIGSWISTNSYPVGMQDAYCSVLGESGGLYG